MEINIFTSVKPIKKIGNILGFIPFCIDKTNNKFHKLYILNCCYSFSLILIMFLAMYLNSTIILSWFVEHSSSPVFVYKIVQTLPMVISILHTFGVIMHTHAVSDVISNFQEIDEKVKLEYNKKREL